MLGAHRGYGAKTPTSEMDPHGRREDNLGCNLGSGKMDKVWTRLAVEEEAGEAWLGTLKRRYRGFKISLDSWVQQQQLHAPLMAGVRRAASRNGFYPTLTQHQPPPPSRRKCPGPELGLAGVKTKFYIPQNDIKTRWISAFEYLTFT